MIVIINRNLRYKFAKIRSWGGEGEFSMKKETKKKQQVAFRSGRYRSYDL